MRRRGLKELGKQLGAGSAQGSPGKAVSTLELLSGLESRFLLLIKLR